jgi:hypothetical protein
MECKAKGAKQTLMRTMFQYALLPNAFQHTNVVGELHKSFLANIRYDVHSSAECQHDATSNPEECNVTIISII